MMIKNKNIDPPRLCNGTRLTVKKLMNNLIEATIVTGPYKGTNVLLPRIPIQHRKCHSTLNGCNFLCVWHSQ
ncbi:hypothetical protein CVS40_10371 [Lucilia cuprina]|nr:hypothetical protein CVS40_10371 [Lucilia cuprina]